MGISLRMRRSATPGTQVRGDGLLGDWGKNRPNRAGDLVERHACKETRKADGPYAIGKAQDGERPARGGVTP